MPRKKSKANYFTSETEDYIKRYNTSTDQEYRNHIFTQHIYLPFYKLAENIIHTFKFYYTDVEQIEDLKHEIVTVLLEEKIMKFDPDNGAKAYSYFGTIVKRWLINYNNKNYKKLKQSTSFSEVEDNNYNYTHDTDSEGTITLPAFIDSWVEQMYDEIEEMFPSEQDRTVVDAVLTLFKTRNDLEIFKKKALYIYIREMTDCNTPRLTKVVTVLKEDFKKKFTKLYELGHINRNPL